MIGSIALAAVAALGVWGEHPRVDCEPHARLSYIRQDQAYVLPLATGQETALGQASGWFAPALEDGWSAWTAPDRRSIYLRQSDGVVRQVHQASTDSVNRPTLALVGSDVRLVSQSGQGLRVTDHGGTRWLVGEQEFELQFPSCVPAGCVFANEWSTGKDNLGWVDWSGAVQRITNTAEFPGPNDAAQAPDGTTWATWTQWRQGCGFCSLWLASRSPAGVWSEPSMIVNRKIGGEHSELVPSPRLAIVAGSPAVVYSTYDVPDAPEVFLWYDGRLALVAAGREPDLDSCEGGETLMVWTGTDGQLYLMADDEAPTPAASPAPTIAPEATATPTLGEDVATPTPAPQGEASGLLARVLAFLLGLLLLLPALTGGMIR